MDFAFSIASLADKLLLVFQVETSAGGRRDNVCYECQLIFCAFSIGIVIIAIISLMVSGSVFYSFYNAEIGWSDLILRIQSAELVCEISQWP